MCPGHGTNKTLLLTPPHWVQLTMQWRSSLHRIAVDTERCAGLCSPEGVGGSSVISPREDPPARTP